MSAFLNLGKGKEHETIFQACCLDCIVNVVNIFCPNHCQIMILCISICQIQAFQIIRAAVFAQFSKIIKNFLGFRGVKFYLCFTQLRAEFKNFIIHAAANQYVILIGIRSFHHADTICLFSGYRIRSRTAFRYLRHILK